MKDYIIAIYGKYKWWIYKGGLYLTKGWYGPNRTPVDVYKGDKPIPVNKGKKYEAIKYDER